MFFLVKSIASILTSSNSKVCRKDVTATAMFQMSCKLSEKQGCYSSFKSCLVFRAPPQFVMISSYYFTGDIASFNDCWMIVVLVNLYNSDLVSSSSLTHRWPNGDPQVRSNHWSSCSWPLTVLPSFNQYTFQQERKGNFQTCKRWAVNNSPWHLFLNMLFLASLEFLSYITLMLLLQSLAI